MPDFPPYAPSSRDYTDGDWPVKRYQAMDGYEVRVLYGSQQTGMRLNLAYQNLTDRQASEFLEHYQQQKGTYVPFQFGDDDGPKKGWGADEKWIGVSTRQNKWRYAETPKITSVKPGISSVTVNLVSVLDP